MADTNKITYVSLENLGYYDEKLKAWVTTKDEALQANIDNEVTRAKAQEATNAAAAEAAQKAADDAQADVDALSAKVGEVPTDKTVMGIISQIQADAYDDTEVRGLIDGLANTKADKTQVATDIAAAVKVETDARVEAVAGVQGEVDALEQTHATDKAALEGAIALKADKTALDAVSDVANAAVKQADYDVKVKALEDEDARIVGLVEAEAERAAGVEANLQTQINTIMNNPDTEGVINSINEFTQYIEDHGEIAEGFRTDIDALDGRMNAAETALGTVDTRIATAITNANLDQYATDTELAAAVGRIGALETADGEQDTLLAGLRTDVNAKVAQTDYDAKVSELEGVDEGLAGRITALENANGEGGSVTTAIATAKQEAIDAAAQDATTKANQALANAKAYADEEDAKIEARVDALETASATHALASDLTALAGRVTTAEGEIDTLQTEMDAVEALAAANKAAHEANAAAIALKASQADFNALEGRVDAVEEWQANMVEATEAEINGLFA